MHRLFRLLCASLIALSLGLGFAPDADAKKSRSSSKKSAKSSKSSRSKASRSSKKGSKKSASRRRSSSRRESTVAKERTDDRSNASTDRTTDSQDEPPQPRAVASGISQDRVMEIQAALNKAGYYSGEVNGVYDDSTKQAMRQYQQANNLSASGMPSAHALKKLGVSKRSNSVSATPIKKASDGGTQE